MSQGGNGAGAMSDTGPIALRTTRAVTTGGWSVARMTSRPAPACFEGRHPSGYSEQRHGVRSVPRRDP